MFKGISFSAAHKKTHICQDFKNTISVMEYEFYFMSCTLLNTFKAWLFENSAHASSHHDEALIYLL